MNLQISGETKQAILQEPLFGKWIAEDEADVLYQHFYESDDFRKFFTPYATDKDVVYGQKGMGKSAIYCLLLNPGPALKRLLDERNIVVVEAEATRGTSVFRDLAGELDRRVADFSRALRERPKDELNDRLDTIFEYLWKLYFLVLLGEKLQELGYHDRDSRQVIDALQLSQLLPRRENNDSRNFLDRTVRAVLDYVMDYMRRIQSVEGVLNGGVAPTGPSLGTGGKLVFFSPRDEDYELGFRSVDDLLTSANRTFASHHQTVWLVIDHLDIAFSRNPTLERRAIGALIDRVYKQFRMGAHPAIRLKVFLRSDIWERLIAQGMRIVDAHIIGGITLSWSDQAILELITQRFLANGQLCEAYQVGVRNKIQGNTAEQRRLFFDVLPDQVGSGQAGQNSIDWLLLWTKDGSGQSAPRNILHVLAEAQDAQVASRRVPAGSRLFGWEALVAGQNSVSTFHYRQALLIENPDIAQYVTPLAGGPCSYTLGSLLKLWRRSVRNAQSLTEATALKRATHLTELGVFVQRRAIPELQGLGYTVNEVEYTIAPLYHHALGCPKTCAHHPL